MRDIIYRSSQYDSPGAEKSVGEEPDSPEVTFLRDINGQVNLLRDALGNGVHLLDQMELDSETNVKTLTLPNLENVQTNTFLPIHVKFKNNEAHWLLGVYNGISWILFDSNRDKSLVENEILVPIMSELKTHFADVNGDVKFFDHPFLNAGYEKDDKIVDTCFHLMFYVAIQLKYFLQDYIIRKPTIKVDTPLRKFLKPPWIPDERIFDHPARENWRKGVVTDAYTLVQNEIEKQEREKVEEEEDSSKMLKKVYQLSLEDNDGVTRTLF